MTDRIPAREITPPHVYFNRRAFIRGGIVVASAAATGAVYRGLNGASTKVVETAKLAGLDLDAAAPAASGFRVDEPVTKLADITHYNNFYEFSTDKDGVADKAAAFKTNGWQIRVDGLVGKPKTFDLADLLAISPPEERVYRMRCVEAWSMVIPWARLLALQAIGKSRAHQRGKVRGLPNALRSEANAGAKYECFAMALRGGAPARRSDAPAHPPCKRHLRKGAAPARRRSHSPRDSLEVRLQGYQVDRKNIIGRFRSAHQLATLLANGVRVSGQRESARGPSALEPSNGAAHR